MRILQDFTSEGGRRQHALRASAKLIDSGSLEPEHLAGRAQPTEVLRREREAFGGAAARDAPDVFPVVRGDAADAVAVADALLLVYPPPTPMARDALDAFGGRLVLYAGEPRGGANGDALFFDKLEAHFVVREVVALDPFPGGAEKLYVLERRPWWWRRGLIRRKTTPV